jgi:hypothetical protein
MPADAATATIEVQVSSPEQLFNSLDPFPFRDRDLDKAAEEFIVGWARELPSDKQIDLVVHLPAQQAGNWQALGVEDAFHRYFAYRAEIIGRDLSELFRVGRRSLQIGLTVLLLSAGASELSVAAFGREGFATVLNEGLIILGWVANWRPLEIFLYAWWPIAGQRQLYRRLAQAHVALVLHENDTALPSGG